MNSEKSARSNAITYYNQALAGVATDPQLAYRLLCSAVTIDPSFGQGWYVLGNSCADLKKLDAAVACYRRALMLPDGDESGDMNAEHRKKCLVNLSHNLYHSGHFNEAEEVTKQCMSIDEAVAFSWTNLSLIHSLRGHHEKAIYAARKGFDLDPTPVAETALAFALLFAGRYAEGLKHFEARIAYKMPHLLSYPYPMWKGERRGTLLVLAEQGSGDAVSFTRFIPLACKVVGKVIFSVMPHLVRLLQNMVPENCEVIPTAPGFPIADYWVPVGSLPVALGLSTAQFAHCHDAPVHSIPYFRDGWQNPTAKLHVGVAWFGSTANDINHHRSFPVDLLLQLYRVPGVQLYSLQIGENAADLHNAGAAGLIRDMSPYITDAMDTISIMKNLDLVISVESFVAHLAGTIHKECWIPYSYAGGDYRIGRTEEGSLWYPKHKIFKQAEDCRWEPVFDRIVDTLRVRAS